MLRYKAKYKQRRLLSRCPYFPSLRSHSCVDHLLDMVRTLLRVAKFSLGEVGIHELTDLCVIRLYVESNVLSCAFTAPTDEQQHNQHCNLASKSGLISAKTILLFLLEIAFRVPWRMCLHVIIELLAGELALAYFILVLVRCDAVFSDTIAMAVFNGLGDV